MRRERGRGRDVGWKSGKEAVGGSGQPNLPALEPLRLAGSTATVAPAFSARGTCACALGPFFGIRHHLERNLCRPNNQSHPASPTWCRPRFSKHPLDAAPLRRTRTVELASPPIILLLLLSSSPNWAAISHLPQPRYTPSS
jgi:hypothetical protein